MSTIRGWFANGFNPKSCGENYVHVPRSGTGKSLVHESNELFGKIITQDSISGRWYLETWSPGDRFEVREELGKLVAEWTLKDHYRRPNHGPMYPTVYGADEGRTGTARFEPNLAPDCSSFLLIEGCESIEDLRDLYFAVRRGTARIIEVWDGRNCAPESAKITELEQQIAGCQARIEQLDSELGREKIRVSSAEAALKDAQGAANAAIIRANQCETDLRLLRESVRWMIAAMWRDMCNVSWWHRKRYMMRIVCNAMRANAHAFECARGTAAHAAIETFSRED